ncbi:MAG: hypothetical protein PHC75_05475 [Burkholderiales bacterium]|nr:hypothetical protein [Burkholderiales bacterium]
MTKHLLKKIITSSIIALSITSCNEGANNNTLHKEQTMQSIQISAHNDKYNIKNQMKLANEMLQNNIEPNISLGDGYDSRTEIGTGINCLANSDSKDNIELSNPKGTIDFKNTIDIDKISNYLHTGGSAGGGFAGFSASASADYVKASADTRQSINFNYLQTMSMDANYKMPSPGATTKILDPDIKSLLDDSPNDFTTVCGDSFLMSAKMGAILLVDAQLNFKNSTAKEEFKSKASAGFIFGKAGASFDKISSDSKENSSISIRILQLGGDPTKLANIFGDKQKSGYHIIQCSIDNIASCDQVANNVIQYAQTDFQKNVDFHDYKTLYAYDFYNKPWSKLAIKATLPELSTQTQEAIKYLNNTLELDKKMLQYLQAYQQQSFWNRVDEVSKANILYAKNDYQKMLKEYLDSHILEACYSGGSDINKLCPITADNIKKMRQKYQVSIDLTNRLSSAILMTNSTSTLTFTFIPLSTTAGCTLHECYGLWVSYVSLIYTKSFSWTAIIDTTNSNTYFKNASITNPTPQFLLGKSIYIYSGNGDMYVGRVAGKDPSSYGVFLHTVNGKEADFNPPSYTQMYYSSDDFKYNPI